MPKLTVTNISNQTLSTSIGLLVPGAVYSDVITIARFEKMTDLTSLKAAGKVTIKVGDDPAVDDIFEPETKTDATVTSLAALRAGTEGQTVVARCATTAQKTLSGVTAIDGVTPAAGDIILVRAQNTGSENGLYVAASGAWTRLVDGNSGAVLKAGTVVSVQAGTTYASTQWTCTNTGAITLGSTSVTFGQGATTALSTSLASNANGAGAALIGIEDAAGKITATTAEGALAEIALFKANLGLTTNGNGASLVGIEDSAALITATNIETALAELVKYIPLNLADPGTGVAIGVTRSAYVGFTFAGTETNTLAIPSYLGQVMILNADTATSGSRAVTCAQAINQTGNTIMTFAQARDCIVLKAIKVGGALRWTVTANDGVALS